MVKNEIIVASVLSQGLGVRATARKYGVSPAWVSTLVSRYRAEGPSALEPRSKRPLSNAKATPPEVEDRIIELRKGRASASHLEGLLGQTPRPHTR